MTINKETTVKAIALTVPSATRIFEDLGIDYCCGGNLSLTAACDKAKVPIAKVVEALERPGRSVKWEGNERYWQSARLSQLIDHIVNTHHTFTRSELARIERLAEKVCSAHGQNHPELMQVREVFRSLREDLIPHMLKEEQVLFPYVDALEEAVSNHRPVPPTFFVTVQNPVRMMMMEHDKAGDILRNIRKLTNDFTLPSDACMTFHSYYQALHGLETDLHQHIHLENNILFPRAIEMEGAPRITAQNKLERGHEHTCFGD
jgi:iron-sulfur cluster repair di-iron protein